MAIFSRRILQRLIDENDKFLNKEQTKKHVAELNRGNLAFEWEIVLLNGLSKVGQVAYEKNFNGRTKPDIYFETRENPDYNFVADITTASDKGLEEQNPFEALRDELIKVVEEHGLSPSSFDLQVGGGDNLSYKGGPKVKLKLPKSTDFEQTILNKPFKTFLEKISQNLDASDEYSVKNTEIDVTISYKANQQGMSGGHPSFTQVFSLSRNTIYRALASKVDQLTNANFEGPLGIFLCDGGCSLFQNRSTAGLSYSLNEILQYFLQRNKQVSFIVTFTTRREHPFGGLSSRSNLLQIFSCFYKGINFDRIDFKIFRVLEDLMEILPEPQSNPQNAVSFLKRGRPNEGRSYWGGIAMRPGKSRTQVKISARALLELLAGTVGQKEFFERHEFIPSEMIAKPARNPFELGLREGQLIEKITIEKSDSDDDDWITLELRGPDPAISPFTMPTSNSESAKK